MVEVVLAIVAIVEAFLIVYLLQRKLRLKKEFKRLQSRHKESKRLLGQLRLGEKREEVEEPVDRLALHDRIVEMSESGIESEQIAERLEIPLHKVALTLKFAKMKQNGA